MKTLSILLAGLSAFSATAGAALPKDQLGSPMFGYVGKQVFGENAVVRFDPRVKVDFPTIADNLRSFPVQVDARGIPDVVRIVIFADMNPIQQSIDFTLANAEPFIATRIKLDQRTPVRGAVQLTDGSWLVSGGWIDAAGGGCSAPPVSRVKGDWAQHLGESRGRLWESAGAARIMLSFRHPMDTGFVDNIPAYYLEQIKVTSSGGTAIGTVHMQASVAEDPVLTLMPKIKPGESVSFDGRDTNGIEYAGILTAATVGAAPQGAGR